MYNSTMLSRNTIALAICEQALKKSPIPKQKQMKDARFGFHLWLYCRYQWSLLCEEPYSTAGMI